MKYFNFIRGGMNSSEKGTYCCIALNSQVIAHSSIPLAFGKETELSAIENAVTELKNIISELEDYKNEW
jgi:hypothetical protein